MAGTVGQRRRATAARGARAGQVGSGGGGRARCPSPCPRVGPPSPALSRSARRLAHSELARSLARSLPLSRLSVSLALCLAPLGLFPSPAASFGPSLASFLACLGSLPLSVSRSLRGAGGSPKIAALTAAPKPLQAPVPGRWGRGGARPRGEERGEGGALVISPLQSAPARARTHGRSPSSLRSRGPWSPPGRPPAASGRCSACCSLRPAPGQVSTPTPHRCRPQIASSGLSDRHSANVEQ